MKLMMQFAMIIAKQVELSYFSKVLTADSTFITATSHRRDLITTQLPGPAGFFHFKLQNFEVQQNVTRFCNLIYNLHIVSFLSKS